jgi:uncharacterized protein YbjT (DUF2867 family)
MRIFIIGANGHTGTQVVELASAIPGHDVVLSALGVRPPQTFRPHTLWCKSVRPAPSRRRRRAE